MSLLERIAGRQAESQGAVAQQEQQQAAEAQMPNAADSAVNARQSYGSALAQGPREDLSEEPASPEEQEEFTRAERMIAEVVYGDTAGKQIVEAVRAAQDPIEGVGKVAADLVQNLEQKMGGMSEDVLFAAGESAVEQVVELVEASDQSIDLSSDQMAEALSIGLTAWMEKNPNRVDDDMSAYMGQEAPAQL